MSTSALDEEAERAAEAFSAILRTLRTQVSSELVSESCWDSVHEWGRGVPLDAAAMFGFEFHLSDPDPFAEPFITLRPGSLAARHYCDTAVARDPDCPQAAIVEYLESGGNEMDGRPDRARLVFLEFDRDQLPPNEQPVPGIFMKASCAAPVEGVARLVARAAGREASARALANFQGVVDAFEGGPDDVVQIGVMASRSLRALRVASQPLLPVVVPGILERVRWPGPIGSVAECLDGHRAYLPCVRIALDVADHGVLRRLGIEIMASFAGDLWSPGCEGWKPLVAGLASDGTCLPGKADGLLAWPGRDIVFWGSSCIRLHSGFSHFKLLFDAAPGSGESLIQAKAYSAAGYWPFGRPVR